jgi:hypothetical protein
MSNPYTRPSALANENEPETVKVVVREKYERCAFCNSKLLFNHDLNLHHFEVIETSRCPSCGVSMTPKKFSLN